MNRKRLLTALMWTSLVVLPLAGQPHGTSKPGETRSELRLQFLSFDNFFNVSAPAPAQTVDALQAEYRGAHRLSKTTELYWHLNFLEYDQSNLQNAYGGRLGAAHEDAVHEYKAYVDLAKNRPASELRNGGTADRATVYGEYGIRPSPRWQFVIDGSHENQRFRKAGARDNDFNGLEAFVHYDGLGYRITPELGLAAGRRNVNDNSQSYQNRDVIAGVELVPVDPLYLSVAYRLQRRTYNSASPSSNEHHGILEVVGDWHAARRVHLTLYYANEDVNSSLPQSDYRTGILILGTSYSF